MRILVVDDDQHLALAVQRGLEAEGFLGLAIAQSIARQHDGRITIENGTVGARFVVRLPAQPGHVVAL